MCGGNLWADLPSEKKGHDLFHRAVVLPGTSLAKHLKIKSKKSAEIDIEVNSYHHQAVKELGPSLLPVLVEPESRIIEGYESINGKIRAVQSHPEYGDKEFALRTEICEWLFRIEK
jgi:putative glutamine amidotransferase